MWWRRRSGPQASRTRRDFPFSVKFTRGLNPTPSFSPEAETLALPWWSRSQGTRSHATPRRARCYPVSARIRSPIQSGGCFVLCPAHEGRGTHPLVTWGVREPTNLLAPPGQASRPARGSGVAGGPAAAANLKALRLPVARARARAGPGPGVREVLRQTIDTAGNQKIAV